MSDGKLSPADLVARARERGVRILSITDHDEVAATRLAQEAARDSGVTIIPGVEWSASWNGSLVHIVGLGGDQASDVVMSAVASQTAVRRDRYQKILDKITRTEAERTDLDGMVEIVAKGKVPSRPIIAEAMIRLGKVKDIAEAFGKFLGTGKKGDVAELWPDLSEIVDWINSSGGVAVLAHPKKYKISATKLRALIGDFVEVGGEALEVASGIQKSGDTGHLAELCRRHKLAASAGSDFHGPVGWSDLGKFSALPENLASVLSHARLQHWQCV